jgi:hypothetical protein
VTHLIWVWDVQDLDFNWAPYNPGDRYWDLAWAELVFSDNGNVTNTPQQIQDLYNATNVITRDQMPRWD